MALARTSQVSARTVTQASGSLPAPSGPTDGASLASWETGPGSYSYCVARISGNAAGQVSSAYLWGYDGARWDILGRLNGGDPMVITDAARGWASLVSFAGGYRRLAVSGSISGLTAATVDFVPVEWVT